MRVLLEDQRTWSNQAHFAADHVPQLRKLVDRKAPQGATETSYPWVVIDLEHTRVTSAARVPIEMGHIGFAGISVHDHRAKLVDGERLPPRAHPHLSEQHRAGRV